MCHLGSLGASCNAEADLNGGADSRAGRLADGMGDCIAIQGVEPDVIEADFLGFKPDDLKAVLEYITCELRLGERVLAAVADLPLADEAIVVANARLEEAVGCGAVCPVDLDAVLGLLLDADLGKVGYDIGREVGVGVLDLVEGLLLDRRNADEAAVPGSFVTTPLPSSSTSMMGKPRFHRSGTSLWPGSAKYPPQTWPAHSSR